MSLRTWWRRRAAEREHAKALRVIKAWEKATMPVDEPSATAERDGFK